MQLNWLVCGVLAVLTLFIMGRSLYSGLYGQYGYHAYAANLAAQERTKKNLIETERKIALFEKKIKGINEHNPNLELLDEQLRKRLGMIGKKELAAP